MVVKERLVVSVSASAAAPPEACLHLILDLQNLGLDFGHVWAHSPLLVRRRRSSTAILCAIYWGHELYVLPMGHHW